MESVTEATSMENEEGMDRISDLPDSILANILLYLPTKDAMATSVLSTRWKNVFPFIMKPLYLEFDDSKLLHPDSDFPSSNFVNFVDKMLNIAPCVNGMCLYCDNSYADAKIISWVSAALRFNVGQLELDISLDEPETLFNCLNGCKSLYRLVLSLNGPETTLVVPEKFSLPSLRILELVGLTIDDDEDYSINELIWGCPALEDLCFNECTFWIDYGLYIHGPMLNNLVLKDDGSGYINYLDLDVPNLEKLTCSFFAPKRQYVFPSKSLTVADIDFELQTEPWSPAEHEDIANLVAACSSTLRLHLSALSIDALRYSPSPLPVFQNLIFLALGSLGCHGWALLANMLLGAPNLENLTFKEGFNENEGGYSHFESILPSSPRCVELRIESIEFQVFDGKEDEIKLLGYFLKNGKVLKKAVLRCQLSMDISILNRLLMLPSCSKIVLEQR